MLRLSSLILLACVALNYASENIGADMPWTTYEAENMTTTGTILGPNYSPYRVETESSHQQCVQLADKQYVKWTSESDADAMVIRYSLPDAPDGGQAELLLFLNHQLIKTIPIHSRFAHLYGDYPFSNNPADGKHRNFYDEVRVKGVSITSGDILRLKVKRKTADSCVIDLIDLEKMPPPKERPAGSLSFTERRFVGDGEPADFTDALRACIAAAASEGKSVWLPEGTFQISGDIEVPANLTIQGAGMWHTTLLGDDSLYTDSKKRVRIIGNGSNIHLADFAIIGKLNYRNDREPNDGIVGSFGTNSTIARIWVEHTKVGVWVNNCKNLLVEGCRFRNTIADGVNFCVGVAESTIKNNTTRGTGDDCFAIWPATHARQEYPPGFNTIRNCTGQLPFLANGAAVYGGNSNKVVDCTFTDIGPGSAILISTTFPTANSRRQIDNNFSGTTVIQNCDITRSGGFDHVWEWRAAVQLCLDRRSISGIRISNVNITDSISDGMSIIAPGSAHNPGTLTDAVFTNITITHVGLGAQNRHGLWIRQDATGSVILKTSTIPALQNDSATFSIQ